MSIFENGWNLIFLLFAVLGLFFSYYFYKKSRRFKKVCYFHKSINLIKNNLPKLDNLELLYDGERIRNLTITNYAIWNEGTETINKSDVAPSNNLKITAKEDIYILEYEVTFIKNKSNNFKTSFSQEQNVIIIDFDYFDEDEGIILKIYHTGDTNNDLKLLGAIKGVKKLNDKNLNIKNLNYDWKDKLAFQALINIPLVLIMVSSIISNGLYNTFNIFGIIFTGFWILLNILLLIVTRKRVPTGFEIVAKDFGYTE